ncbi:MAG: hypothetical protein B0W54_17365 [Cellvibrio sp. 79]|nr:MAG: hypothetical protein B0W54_17365 [Cellvibrio sp. 79]
MTSIIHYYQHLPDEFKPWVESIWMVENIDTKNKPVVVLPDGRIDIHFFSIPGEPFQTSLAGIDTQASYTEINAGSRVYGICFYPLAVEYLLQTPLSKLINGRANLERGFWDITEQDTDNFERFKHKIFARLTQLDITNVDPRKLKMFSALHQSQGHISVTELAEHCHWSSRQINRYFNQWLGLSVKAYTSILRFRASFSTLKTGKLFPESDFSDQSHFIKEIKKYSGHTPKQLYKNQDDRFIQLSILK